MNSPLKPTLSLLRINPHALEWLTVLGLALLALIPRLYRLSSAPPGLSGDEIFNALDALRIGDGYWPVFFSGNNGREPLFLYLMAASMRLLGETVVAVRLPAALLGAGSVVLTYLIGRDAFNRRAGILAAALMAVSLWPLIQSHWALRAISLTFTTALAVYFYLRAARSGRRRDWLLAGFSLGATLYTYIPARVFTAVIIGWFAWLLISGAEGWRPAWHRHGRGFLLSLLVALLLMAPFIGYAYLHPDLINQRVDSLQTALDLARAGEPAALGRSVAGVLKSFTITGDNEWRYHLSGRPIFDPLSGTFFYLGLALCAWRGWQRGRGAATYALLLLWIGAMVSPVAILEDNASLLRMAGAMVPIYLIAGIGFDEAARWLVRRRPGRAWRLLPLLVIAGLSITLTDSWRDYFDTWSNHAEVRHIYHGELAQMARYLDRSPPASGTRVFIGYKNVTEYTTPRAYDFFSKVPVDWFLYTESFAWEAAVEDASEVWYLIPPSHRLPAEVVAMLNAAGTAEPIHYSNGDLAFTHYRTSAHSLRWEPEHPLDLQFVDGPRLTGYDLPPVLYQGDAITLTIHGRIPVDLPRLPNQLTYLRAQLEDASGNVWAGQDALLGYPQASWNGDDQFVQQLPLNIPTGIPPGAVYFRFALRDNEGQLLRTIPGSQARSGPFPAHNRPLADFSLTPEMPVYGDQLALRQASFSTLLLPGMPLDIALEWVALTKPAADYRIQLELWAPGAGEPYYSQISGLWPEAYPTSQWAAQEQVTSFHRLAVPLEIPTDGTPTLHLRLLPAQEDMPIPLTQGSDKLADMTLVVRDHLFERPPIERPLTDAQFGPAIRLLGYDLDTDNSRPGGEVGLTLYWQATERPAESYTVFNHIAGPDGQIQGQFDSPPVGDAWLTETWLPGEIIIDRRTIPLRSAAPPGRYQLLVGLYDAGTGRRLPVWFEGQQQPNDQLLLVEVEVAE